MRAEGVYDAGAGEVIVRVDHGSTLGHWLIEFESDAVPGALAAFAGTLALNRLDISSAIVHKSGNRVADTFDVCPLPGSDFTPERAAELGRVAAEAMSGRRNIGRELAIQRGKQDKVAEHPTSVELSTDSDLTTGVTVKAEDRLGLLHDIASTLTTYGLRTRSLTALTFGGRAHDAFRVVDASGAPPREAGLLESVRYSLIAACSG